MSDPKQKSSSDETTKEESETGVKYSVKESKQLKDKAIEVGGRTGPDPVRYGDWEKGGRCIDF